MTSPATRHALVRRALRLGIAALCLLPAVTEPADKRHRETASGGGISSASSSKTVPIPPELSDSRPTEFKAPSAPPGPAPGASPLSRATPGADSGAPGLLRPCQGKHGFEELLALPDVRHPQRAGSGGLYLRTRIQGIPQIVHQAAPSAPARPVVAFPHGIHRFHPSPADARLLVLVSPTGSPEFRVRLVDPAAKAPLSPLSPEPAHVESVAWIPDGSGFLFTATEGDEAGFYLGHHELREKKTRVLVRLGSFHELDDVSPDGSRAALTRRQTQTDTRVRIWEKATNTVRDLEELAQGTSRKGRFTADSRGLLVLADRGAEQAQLHYVPLAGQSALRVLSAGKWGVDEFAVSRDRLALAFAWNEQGHSRLSGVLMDAQGRKRRHLEVPEISRGVVRDLALEGDGDKRTLYYVYSDSLHPHAVWQWSSGKKIRWTGFAPSLRPSCFLRETLVHYPGTDGTPIPAWLYLPAGSSGPAPFVLYAPPAEGYQFRPEFQPAIQYFLERGYGVLAPNPRGSRGYGRSYLAADDLAGREIVIRDVMAGARWLKDQRYSRPDRTVVFGESYGGFLSLAAALGAPAGFAAAAAGDAFGDLREYVTNAPASESLRRQREFGSPEGAPWLGALSLATKLPALSTPTLLMHEGSSAPPWVRPPGSRAVATAKGPPLELRRLGTRRTYVGDRAPSRTLEQARWSLYFFERYTKKEKGS